MTVPIVLIHSANDAKTAEQLAAFFEAAAPGLQSTLLTGTADTGALRESLGAAAVVVGLLTAEGRASGSVMYQLGAAWALGRPLALLLDPAAAQPPPHLPLSEAEASVLGGDSVMELAFSLASSAGLESDLSHATRLKLAGLFPDWEGLERQSGERPIATAESAQAPEGAAAGRPVTDTQQLWPVSEDTQPEVLPSGPERPAPASGDGADAAAESGPQRVQAPALAPQPQPAAEHTRTAPGLSGPVPEPAPTAGNGALPSCDASLLAGRAMSDCMFHREQGGPFASELDTTFGAFLSALGGNWSALRELEDLELWMETADNVLDGLEGRDLRLRHWYEIGFQLSTLLNLGAESADVRADEGARQVWDGAFQAFGEAARQAGIGGAALIELEGMLDNLQGPEDERDFTLIGRVQERVRDLARSDDGERAAAAG